MPNKIGLYKLVILGTPNSEKFIHTGHSGIINCRAHRARNYVGVAAPYHQESIFWNRKFLLRKFIWPFRHTSHNRNVQIQNR